jgi:hypothetical protein
VNAWLPLLVVVVSFPLLPTLFALARLARLIRLLRLADPGPDARLYMYGYGMWITRSISPIPS